MHKIQCTQSCTGVLPGLRYWETKTCSWVEKAIDAESPHIALSQNQWVRNEQTFGQYNWQPPSTAIHLFLSSVGHPLMRSTYVAMPQAEKSCNAWMLLNSISSGWFQPSTQVTHHMVRQFPSLGSSLSSELETFFTLYQVTECSDVWTFEFAWKIRPSYQSW